MTHLPGGWVALCAHATAIAGVAWVILRWCRAIAAVDARLGIIVGLGTLLRLALGVALFWVSYFAWSPLAGLHSGDGFWELAPDARYYFLAAADAATDRLSLVESGGPSPTFVVTLALWMRLVGATPAAAVLMNALLAAAACRLVVSVLHEAREPLAKRAMLVIVTGLSLSPALVLFAAQGLKDQFVVSLLVLAAAGLLWWLEARQTMPVHRLKNAGAWLIVAIAVFCIAGVRAYLAFFMLAAVGAALLVQALPWHAGWRRRAAGALVSMPVLWLAFMVGAGPYYQQYGGMVARVVPTFAWAHLPATANRLLNSGVSRSAAPMVAPAEAIENARAGFVRTPGATNLVSADGSQGNVAVRLLRGFAATLLPISALKATGVVEFTGGRGLLVVTDIDAIVNLLLVAVAASLVFAWGRRPRHIAYVVYAIALAAAVWGPMAYVVTNFGTLFRLRVMAFVLVWLVLLGLARTADRAEPGR